jgi:ferrochelatase
MAKRGVLLVNIGSPERPEPKEVATYLKKFLMDKKVIDLPFLLRWILVHWLIVPRRSIVSAQNYAKIWMRDVNLSPLVYYTQKLRERLADYLGQEFLVVVGMAYTSPSVQDAFNELQKNHCNHIMVVPLFPQYAEATTGSITDEVRKIRARLPANVKVDIFPPFFRENAFISRAAEIAKKELKTKKVDHYLFSFHGLPEKQILQDKTCHLTSECCKTEQALQKNCYRAQCFKTAELIAKQMGLDSTQWSLSFQSRLGRAQWLQPYTNEVLTKLAQQGTQRVAILSPSFVADCLETLEELGIAAQEIFLESGGKEFTLVPCVNLDNEWIQGLGELIKQKI